MDDSSLTGFRLMSRRCYPRAVSAALFFLLLLAACSAPPTPASPTAVPAVTATLDGQGPIAFLARAPGSVRVLSFNPYWDSIFPDTIPEDQFVPRYDKAAAFRRIVAATAPDLLCLQEIAPARDPQQVATILDEVLPLESGGWQVQQGQDTVIASRYPLSLRDTALVHQGIGYSLGHVTALADLPDAAFDRDLYVVCAHFMAQGGAENIAARQAHADRIVAWLADARTPGGEVDLPSGTPFLVLGDLNVYDTDPAHHLTTLLTGDVVDEERFGPDGPPDWDGTDLTDVLPRHNGAGTDTYTWRDDTQQFNPGALDHILYSDSTLTLVDGFVLNTAILNPAALESAGLEAADVALDLDSGDYDHLPLVADFR